MAVRNVSREPSPAVEKAVRSPQTLHDVKLNLGKLKLKPSFRSDLISSLHAVAKPELRQEDTGIDAALARISVDARMLIPRLDRRVGVRCGYSKQSWSNIGWRVRKALQLAGAWELFHSRRVPTSSLWRKVTEACASSETWYIRTLGEWGTLHKVAPEALNQDHLPHFFEWLSTWKPQRYARKCFRRALRDWNIGVQSGSWQGQELPIKAFENSHYSVPMNQWSRELIASVDRTISMFREPYIDDEDFPERVSEKTAKTYRERLFRTLSAYVAAKKLDPFSIKDISELIDPPAIKAALDFMLHWTRRRKPNAVRTSDIRGSAKLIATIAERCYRNFLPGDVIVTLQRMARNRSPVRGGMTPKNRELLKLFDDEKVCGTIP